MKTIEKLVVIVVPLLSFTACSSLTEVEIQPREAQRGDLWCQYEVTGVSGGGAIPVGSVLCVLCPDPGTLRCASYAQSSLVPAEGIQYTVDLQARSCGSCPSGTQNRGWNYELR